MKKILNKATAIILATAIICTAVIAFAYQEITINQHRYDIVDFADGVAYVRCADCGAEDEYYFDDYINDYEDILDVVPDGIVNAKDYAKLYREYK